MRLPSSLHPLLVLAAVLPAPLAGQGGSDDDASALTPYRAAQGSIRFALTGDAIVSRPLGAYREPEYLRMIEEIRQADAAFTNLEIVLARVEELTPMPSDGESYMFAHPSLAGDLVWAGFDMVSRANNHSVDYGWDGLRSTSRALEEAGIAHAGVGENLALAEEAAYVETANGRVGLISTASTFEAFHAARPQRRDIRATPGLNPLRHQRIHVLPRASYQALVQVARELGQGAGATDTLRFNGQTYAAGDAARVVTRADPQDLRRILASISAAKRQADWVVVATHTHEGAASRELPADFLVEYARAAIDAGADVFVGTGPHVLRGIEIYKGKPIFYSLGNFFFQNETVPFRPSAEWQRVGIPQDGHTVDYYDERQRTSGGYFTREPVYWESVVASPVFQDGVLSEIRLLPITLGYQTPRARRGRPMAATPEHGRRIVERLAQLSAPFGTRIEYRDGVGIIRPGS